MIKVLMLCFLLALIFSIASSFLEKGLGVGEVYLSLEACMGKEMHWSCFHPVTSGGFPFAYIFDSLGRTMIGSIDLVDDPFRLLPFLVNIWVYFLLFIAIFSSIRMRKNNKKV